MSKNFEGEYIMSRQDLIEQATKVRFLALNDLGEGNCGNFGPSSDEELAAVKQCNKNKYVGKETPDSHCMDDRFEGYACQLPGNRAITEIAGDYMNPTVEARPLSELVATKVSELVEKQRVPYFHGDEHKGKAGCAANANLRAVLAYNDEYSELVASLAYTRLRMNGIDSLEHEDIISAIKAGAERAADDSLWDVTPEQVVDIAEQCGAEVEIFKGDHNVAGSREDISKNTFNNGLFRNEHNSDDGKSLGLLSITYGAYINQLKEDGFSKAEIADKMMHACLFTVGILKLACKEDFPAAIIG